MESQIKSVLAEAQRNKTEHDEDGKDTKSNQLVVTYNQISFWQTGKLHLHQHWRIRNVRSCHVYNLGLILLELANWGGSEVERVVH